MAYRNFEHAALSRRSLFRASAYAAAGGLLTSMPLGRMLQAHDVAESFPSIAKLIDQYVDSRKVANIFVTFGRGLEDHAHTIGKGTLGFDRRVQVNENSLYRIYSMTKPITGMAAMMLIDEGKLGLDQPLYEILPAYRNMMVQKQYDGAITEGNLEPAKSPITIRHLLTHTAGLGYGIVQSGPIKDAYERYGISPGQVTRLPIPGISRAKPAPSLKVFADNLAQLPLVLQPGSKWSYSVSLDLLGRVIEVVEGKPFDQVLQERIFNPCGMSSTYFTVPESETRRFTDNYGVMTEAPKPVEILPGLSLPLDELVGKPLPIDYATSSVYLDKPEFPFGGAGLVSSPKDYDRFMRMLLGYGVIDGERVMSEKAVRLATSNLLPEAAQTRGTWVQGQGFGAGGRSVDGSFGWGGAAGTLASVSYKHNIRTALYTQYMPTDAYPMRDEFLAALETDMVAMAGVNR